MTWWVRACAIYNLGGGVVLVAPGALSLLGVPDPGSAPLRVLTSWQERLKAR